MENISRLPLDALGRATGLSDSALHRATDLASSSALALVDALIASQFAEQVVDRVLDSALAQRALRHALSGALLDGASEDIARLADRAIDSPATEQAVARVIGGPVFDEAVARLLESEDLWLLVDEIAHSPSVTDAIGQQSLGFADQVAGAVRSRSRDADDRLEGGVRRLVGRRRREAQPPLGESDGKT